MNEQEASGGHANTDVSVDPNLFNTGSAIDINTNNLTGSSMFIYQTTTFNSRWNFCPNCGQKLEAVWKHCPGCGQMIGTNVVTMPTVYPSPCYPMYPAFPNYPIWNPTWVFGSVGNAAQTDSRS